MNLSQDMTPRAKCPKCGRHIGVKNGKIRDHGKAYGRKDYTNCPGTGTVAPFFAELTITEADILQRLVAGAIEDTMAFTSAPANRDMIIELTHMRETVIREGYFHSA
jgi:ssDNA-binding Zn-finger/Zn-ribbon topoisomerase 1